MFMLLVGTIQARCATFAVAKAVGGTFVLATAFKPSVFLDEHLYPYAGKGDGDNDYGEDKHFPEHDFLFCKVMEKYRFVSHAALLLMEMKSVAIAHSVRNSHYSSILQRKMIIPLNDRSCNCQKFFYNI